jgi:hypothetical protein
MYNMNAPADSPSFQFNAEEIRRLTIYRAAVHAGFYSDVVPSVAAAPDSTLARHSVTARRTATAD